MKRAKCHIRKNDQVEVIAGKEKGKTGKVLTVIPEKQRVIVEKVNFIKRHTRPSARQRQGGIIEREGSIHMSNLMVVCPKCNKPTRIGGRILEDQKKVRVCKKCGEILPN
jgi:large subunit ribosomal protein L24